MFTGLRYVFQSLLLLLLFLVSNTFLFGSAVSSLKILGIYVAVTLALNGLAYLQRREARAGDGWRRLTPGPMEWTALILSFGLTLLFLYVYLFVGSSRADAASQMFILKFLIAGFAIGTAIAFFGSFASEIRWNDEAIEQRRLFRKTSTIRWNELANVGIDPFIGHVRLVSRDGDVVRFSTYQNGAEALRQMLMAGEPNGEEAA
jgi:hypothetical protein